jgi:hypothetical protein
VLVTALVLGLTTTGLAGCTASPPAPLGTIDVPEPPPPSAPQLTALLESRAAAVLSGSSGAVAATEVVGAVSPVRTAATSLPLAQWSYADPVVVGSRDGLVAVRAALTYRLEADAGPVTVPVRLGLRSDGARWLVASETTDGSGSALWELGDLRSEPAAGVLVVAVGGSPEQAQALAGEAARAQRAVAGLWPSADPGSPVLVVVPGTDDVARGLGRDAASLDGVGAVTVTGKRVWVARSVLEGLTPEERQVLLRHELLHAASGTPGRSGIPLWLSEGVAEQAGWLAVDAGPEVWARDLAEAVARDGVTRGLPSDGSFSGGGMRAAYAGAHLAADLIDGAGPGSAREVLRRTLDGDDVDVALRAVTGEGLDGLVARWRERAGSLAGQAPGTIAP